MKATGIKLRKQVPVCFQSPAKQFQLPCTSPEVLEAIIQSGWCHWMFCGRMDMCNGSHVGRFIETELSLNPDFDTYWIFTKADLVHPFHLQFPLQF